MSAADKAPAARVTVTQHTLVHLPPNTHVWTRPETINPDGECPCSGIAVSVTATADSEDAARQLANLALLRVEHRVGLLRADVLSVGAQAPDGEEEG